MNPYQIAISIVATLFIIGQHLLYRKTAARADQLQKKLFDAAADEVLGKLKEAEDKTKKDEEGL